MGERLPSTVALTGCGAVCALGLDVPGCLEGLYAGRVQPPERCEPPPTTLADPPAVFCVEGGLLADDLGPRERTERLAITAARQAVDEAFGGAFPDPRRVGVVLGTTVGCTFDDEAYYRALRRGERPDPEPIRRFERADLAAAVAEALGALGPRLSVVTACAAGADAIAVGARWVASGRCDVVVAGGADALARYPYLGFYRLMNSSPERCRPFDARRRGLNLGEGAGAVVLEPARRAGKRGPAPLALLAGAGSAADAHHPTAPHPEGRGLRRAIALALGRAGLAPEEIGFVNAHGTGTVDNDRVEGQVLATALPRGTPVLSTKGYTGHALGAAGALEAVFTVHNLRDGRVPRSAGLETPDPDCVVVPTTCVVEVGATAALSTSLAFGGNNTALVFARWP